MKSKAKWSLVLSFVLALSLVLSACGSSSTSSSGGKGSLAKTQELTFIERGDMASLDPTQITDAISANTFEEINSGLTRMKNNKYYWDMAKGAPKVSADKKTVTFTLRDGIKWSDGKPVTAQDFVYGWQRQNDPAAKPLYNFLFAAAGVKNAAKIEDQNDPMYGKYKNLGVKALNSKTLQVTFEQPIPPFFYSILSQPQFMPQREDFVKKQGKNYAQGPSNILYNGPFKLSDWNKGNSWTFVKNKDYWDAKNIKLTKVTAKVSKEDATSVNLYKTNKTDVMTPHGDYVNQMKQSYPKEFHTALTSGTFFLYINQKTNKNFKNLNVRKALNAAIDRDSFVKVLFNDGSIPSNFVVPKGFTKGPDGKDFRDVANDGYSAGNAKDAQKYWAKAKKELHIDKLNITLLTSDGGDYKQWSEYLANQIEKNMKGVHVTLNQQPWANYLKLNQSFKFDLAFSGWLPDYQDPMTYLDMWTSKNPQNTTGWSNKQFDKLISSANQETGNLSKRWKALQDSEKLMMQQYPIVPLFQEGQAWVQKSYVKGFEMPLYGPQFDFSHAYIETH